MRSHILWIELLVILMAGLVSCDNGKVEPYIPEPYHLDIPKGFDEMPIPEDNPMTYEAVELGQALFFDPILSNNQSLSCASCHLLGNAFADTLPVSPGVHEDRIGNRNSPSLANVGYLEKLFMEGGVPSLEMQVLAPLGERSEMDLNLPDAVERISKIPRYVDLAKKAYDREVDPWVLTRAIAAYQRTLISGDSKFDQYRYHGKKDAISAEAIKGWDLFQDLECTGCHSGFLLTDQSYANIGLYEDDLDPGRGRLTDDPADHGKFRVPSLRNVAVTAPYMHDGSMETLEEVLDHFASGGLEHPNKSEMIRGFEMSIEQRSQLIAFLESLTDSTFITNRAHLPENLR